MQYSTVIYSWYDNGIKKVWSMQCVTRTITKNGFDNILLLTFKIDCLTWHDFVMIYL